MTQSREWENTLNCGWNVFFSSLPCLWLCFFLLMNKPYILRSSYTWYNISFIYYVVKFYTSEANTLMSTEYMYICICMYVACVLCRMSAWEMSMRKDNRNIPFSLPYRVLRCIGNVCILLTRIFFCIQFLAHIFASLTSTLTRTW